MWGPCKCLRRTYPGLPWHTTNATWVRTAPRYTSETKAGKPLTGFPRALRTTTFAVSEKNRHCSATQRQTQWQSVRTLVLVAGLSLQRNAHGSQSNAAHLKPEPLARAPRHRTALRSLLNYSRTAPMCDDGSPYVLRKALVIHSPSRLRQHAHGGRA